MNHHLKILISSLYEFEDIGLVERLCHPAYSISELNSQVLNFVRCDMIDLKACTKFCEVQYGSLENLY
jgi:hypothetical protein